MVVFILDLDLGWGCPFCQSKTESQQVIHSFEYKMYSTALDNIYLIV